MAFDPKALFSMSYGMYIVGTRLGDKLNAQVANSVIQVTSEPATMAICLNKANYTHDCLKESGIFSVSILEEDVPMTFIGTFGFKSGRDIDKFAGVDFKTGGGGVPIVREWCVSAFEGRIIDSLDTSTHTVFIGRIEASEVFKDATPLTYANYHLIKKGKSPKTAPTFAFNAL
jgi:ferric-chelate reductase [NAD(P)H]